MTESILDCSCPGRAYESVSRLVGMNEAELRAELRSIDVPLSEVPYDYLSRALFHCSPDALPKPSSIFWFHASRVADPSSFLREGIQAKSQRFPYLRSLVGDLAKGMAFTGQNPMSGSMMAKQWINDEGPFGFLIRSVAHRAPGATHCYYEAPELVEDIASALCGENFHDVIEHFRAATIPCIVVFRRPGEPRFIAHALEYVYWLAHGHSDAEAGYAANTNFDGGGAGVPVSDLIRVEILDERSRPLTLRQSDPSTPSKHPTRRMRDHLTVENCS